MVRMNVPAQQKLARIAPVERRDPGAVAGERRDLFAGGDGVEGDEAGVAGCGEEGGCWGEGEGADGFYEACFFGERARC